MVTTREKVKGVVAIAAACFAFAQLPAYSYGEGDLTTTLRDPLIWGAPNAPAGMPAWEGQPPPIGQGFMPPAVTPGMWGPPTLPPTEVSIPPLDGSQRQQASDYAAPYLNPPPSTQGYDSGSINGSAGGYSADSLPAPVTVTNINPGGGLQGTPPIYRWGGQTTADFGHNLNYGNASYAYDFGQKLSQKPDLAKTPQESQDGPRGRLPNQGPGCIRHAPSLPDAQATAIQYGNRILRQDNQRAQLTIAPY